MNRITWHRNVGACLVAAVVFLTGTPAGAAMINISLEAEGAPFQVGDPIDISVLATSDEVLVGFGFDLLVDNELVLFFEGFDASSGFTGVPTPDGDGMGGLSFEGGVVGADVLLGIAHYTAAMPGTASIELAVTNGDLTEGFAQSGSGFFQVSSVPLDVTVLSNTGASFIGGGGGGGGVTGPEVPEPATLVLVATGLVALLPRRR